MLAQSFFNRPTLEVAEDLLGMFLVRRIGSREISFPITEVEAYDGFDDAASHASRGMTARNAPMFGEAGFWYVYLVYGMHWMLNIVTGPKEYPAAVLIRGAGEWDGPGKLGKALSINKTFNNKPANRVAGLWIEDRGVRIKKSDTKRLPRVGVEYAGPVWLKKPYRLRYIGNFATLQE
ncbi:MAG: DNA-3-methyladenine glycosylase [Patescibacteria group bacterium]|nr:DNA-3-methyladenine glycosylase [Patescibacteria group bacterium]